MERGLNPVNMHVKSHQTPLGCRKVCRIGCSWLDPKTLFDVQLSVKRPEQIQTHAQLFLPHPGNA